MNAKEIVRALRCCSNVDTRKPDCDNCPLFDTRLCVKNMLEGAADLIESLQAEIKRLYNEAEINYKIHATLTEDFYGLQAQLSASQHRADAAVEDMENLMSEVGLKNYITCAYCQMEDDDNCFAGDGKCKAKWRGVKEERE